MEDGARMSMQGRIEALSARHRTLEERIVFSEQAFQDSVVRRHQMRAAHPTPDKIEL